MFFNIYHHCGTKSIRPDHNGAAFLASSVIPVDTGIQPFRDYGFLLPE
jgi:hypothetical protein